MYREFSLYLLVLLLLYVLQYSLCQQIKSMFTLRLSSAIVARSFYKRIRVYVTTLYNYTGAIIQKKKPHAH